MRKYQYSKLFAKRLSKLKGKELNNILNKTEEITACEDLNHYKNLSYDLKKYKRVHVNKSFVIIFYEEEDIIYFVDYQHHDNIYK